MLEPTIQRLLEEMIEGGRYRAIILAGGFATGSSHDHSDVDLYAISAEELRHHWTMERVEGRRVELTAYPLERWLDLLAKPYKHPKHHFTFSHGRVLYDPESLCPSLQLCAAAVLLDWPPVAEETLEELRCGVAIQRDKIAGYRQKGMPLHLRLYTEGFSVLACMLLSKAKYGYDVDAGKNLTRLLEDPSLPTDVKELFGMLLGSTNDAEMADAALALADRCLDLTGGQIQTYHGGIPR